MPDERTQRPPDESSDRAVDEAHVVYDRTADTYVDHIGTEIRAGIEAEVDRAIIDRWAADVLGAGGGPVLDVGCGPGRLAARLVALGLDASGVDPAPGMVKAARTAHPGIRFRAGSLTDLPVADGTIAAAACWYSIIHTASNDLASAWSELARALVPDGCLLLGFQAGGGERIGRPDLLGTGLTLTAYRHDPDTVSAGLDAAGFEVTDQTRREPEGSHESAPQAFISTRLVT